MNNSTAKYWIEELNLEPHPEGGYFKEIYRNKAKVKGEDFDILKSAATSIYYLLENDDKSHFHRLKSDEIWYYHIGDPLTVCMFDSSGMYNEIVLGSDIQKGELLQVVIPKGTIFGAHLKNKENFILMGCMVNPGFDFTDFELMNRNEMLDMFPDHLAIIEKLTLH